jgi:hypothetical protein
MKPTKRYKSFPPYEKENLMTTEASIDQQIESARSLIAVYQSNLIQFASGKLTPNIGEVVANELLLKRKQRQLSKLLVAKARSMILAF